jgi:aspartyl/asparaginyl-tRNA synthetase
LVFLLCSSELLESESEIDTGLLKEIISTFLLSRVDNLSPREYCSNHRQHETKGPKMKNVRKNSKLYKKVTSAAKTAKCYSLGNCFRGEECTDMARFNEYTQKQIEFLKVKVYDMENGTFKIYYHSNDWDIVTI